jgi:5-methylthioribose kinase
MGGRKKEGFFAASLEAFLKSNKSISDSDSIKRILPIKDSYPSTFRVSTKFSDLLVKRVDVSNPSPVEISLLNTEEAFYELTQQYEYLARFMPFLHKSKQTENTLVFEDLLDAQDCTSMYKDHIIEQDEIRVMTKWLSLLHRLRFDQQQKSKLVSFGKKGAGMAPLFNHQEFNVRLHEPEMRARYQELNEDSEVLKKINDLSEFFYRESETLIHGNFVPVNWIRSDSGMTIVNPRARFGAPEYDLGLFIAHLRLGQIAQPKVEIIFSSYEDIEEVDFKFIDYFTGFEILYQQFYGPKYLVGSNLKNRIALIDYGLELLLR